MENMLSRFLPSFLRTLETPSLSPALLRLELRGPVVLLWKVTPDQRFCKGTRLRLTPIGRYSRDGQLLGGEQKAEKGGFIALL